MGRTAALLSADCTGPGLSAIRAAAAKVERVLFRLLARFGIDHDLSKRCPAIVAGVGALVLMVMVLGGWVRMRCARLCGVHSSVPTFLWAGLRGVQPPAGPSLVCMSYILLQFTWFYHKFRV